MSERNDRRSCIEIGRATSLWVEGLPLGNGDVGVMFYGGPEQLALAFNKNDVWDDRVNPGQGLPAGTTFDDVVATAGREDWASYNRLFADWLAAENSSGPSLQSAGVLTLAMMGGERPVGVRQELDLAGAKAAVRCEYVNYRDDKQAVDVSAFVPARDSVVPVTIASDGPVWGTVRLSRPEGRDLGPARAWAEGGLAGIDMEIPESVRYTLAVKVVGGRGRWETAAAEAVYRIPPGPGPVVLLATIVTDREAPDARALAAARLAPLGADAPVDLAGPHRAWWQAFWDRSDVTLPDERIERFWRLGMYVLGSCSRPGCRAAGLQGLWNHYTRPCWHTDYHADMNVQMIHWPAYSGNHMELAEPYYRMVMEDWREETRRAAREFFRRRGMYLPIAGGPGGHELAGPWMWPGAGAWIVQHFWWEWLYGRDRGFVARAYPYLKELSGFYEDLLRENPAGGLDIYPSYAPEMPDTRGCLAMAWGANPTGDLAFVRILLGMLVEFAAVLGVDEADRARWRSVLDRLADYPVGPDGRLLDLEGDRWAQVGPMPVTLAPLYPACDVGPDSPPGRQALLQEAFGRARERFAGAGHLMTWFAAAAARLGRGEEALKILNEYLDLTVLPNGLHALRWVPHYRSGEAASGMMQIEATTAFANAVNEMLLQSLDGVLRVFPAAPAGWSASFRTLRAAGAFLVSAGLENGRVSRLCIESLAGCPCVLADPFGAGRAVLRVAGGQEAVLTADARGHFRFSTVAGCSYEVVAIE